MAPQVHVASVVEEEDSIDILQLSGATTVLPLKRQLGESLANRVETGRAEAHVVLGDKVGLQTGEARVAGAGDTVPTTTFSAVAESADNRSPTADFGWTCEQLTSQFTDASADGDGNLTFEHLAGPPRLAFRQRFSDAADRAQSRRQCSRRRSPDAVVVRSPFPPRLAVAAEDERASCLDEHRGRYTRRVRTGRIDMARLPAERDRSFRRSER